MKRISPQTEERIIELWFKGPSREAISRKTGVSTGTVSNIVGRLPECLKQLRTLSVELRKSGISLLEALERTRHLSELKKLDVEPAELEKSIEVINNMCRKERYKPGEVVQHGIRLAELEAQSGKSYLQTIEEFQTKTEAVEELNREISRLQKEKENRELELEQELKQSKVTRKEIEYIKELRGRLRKAGVDLKDVESLQKFLENMQELGGNPKNFLKFTRKHGSLKGRLTSLQKQILKRTEELDEIKRRRESLATKVQYLQATQASLNKEIGRREERIATLERKENEQRGKFKEECDRLAALLNVEAKTEEMLKAIRSKEERLAKLEVAISEGETAH